MTVLVKSAPSRHLLVVAHDPVGPNAVAPISVVAPVTAGPSAMAVVSVHVLPSTRRVWVMRLSAPNVTPWNKRSWR